jgi:AcrR family transcriptional regulator
MRNSTGRGRGRRKGESGTREAILTAARSLFAERGYDRTSLRAIAGEAEVDPALVTHFFGSKQRLFVEVVEFPFDPAEVLPGVLAGDLEHVGMRLAELLVSVLENPEARARVTGVVRAAASEPEAARMVRELLMREVWIPAAALLGVDDAELRMNLVGSQIVGLVMARYIVAAEPLASLPPEGLVAAIGPTLQRYLTQPLAPQDATG